LKSPVASLRPRCLLYASTAPASDMVRTVPSSSPSTHPHSRSVSGSSSATASANRKSLLGMAGVANLFVRVRKAENRIESRQPKPGQTIFVSGEPQTHPCVLRCLQPERLSRPVDIVESYICSGGVNIVPLLVATRSTLLDRIGELGADTMTDEQWECTITSPKPGIYKVQVRYVACATQSPARTPLRPVAMERARGIPGLMTILKRCDV